MTTKLTPAQKRLRELAKEMDDKRGGKSYFIDPRQERDIIQTGFWTLDYTLFTGGVRSGTYVELFGPPSSGKTYLSLVLMAQAQKQFPDKPVAYFDMENAWDPTRSSNLGIDLSYPDKLWTKRPPSQEAAYDDITAMVEDDLFSVIVIDSLAAMIPHAERHVPMVTEGKKGGEDKVNLTVGLMARQNSQAMRRLTAGIKNTLVIFINQVRTGIGQGNANYTPDVTPGGRAVEFYDHNRVSLRGTQSKHKVKAMVWDPKSDSMKEEDVFESHLMNFHLEKSKFGYGAPSRKAHLDYYWKLGGIDPAFDKITCLKTAGLAYHDGQWFSFDGLDKKIQGRAKAREYVMNNPEHMDELLDKAMPLLQKHWTGGRKAMETGETVDVEEA